MNCIFMKGLVIEVKMSNELDLNTRYSSWSPLCLEIRCGLRLKYYNWHLLRPACFEVADGEGCHVVNNSLLMIFATVLSFWLCSSLIPLIHLYISCLPYQYFFNMYPKFECFNFQCYVVTKMCFRFCLFRHKSHLVKVRMRSWFGLKYLVL